MERAIKEIYKHRQDFLIIGLTGRIGSGCTKLSQYMQKEFDGLAIPSISISEGANDDSRKKFIIQKFSQENWKPFHVIKASDIIFTFVFKDGFEKFKHYVSSCGVDGNLLNSLQSIFNEMETKTNSIILKLENKISREDSAALNELHDYMITLGDSGKDVRSALETNSVRDFTKVFQKIGDNIRRTGEYNLDYDTSDGSNDNPENIYNISNRINLIIKAYAKYKQNNGQKAYFVIDAFRNPFEVMFFRERYSAFYLVSVNSSEEDRIDRLHNIMNMTRSDIDAQDRKENPNDLVKDLNSFVSQNIQTCIEKSDIHIHNPGKHENTNFNDLKEQIIKYVSLIQHPGLIPPSRDEKMMQVAYTAKLNSGCISRQVGAVVTNKQESLRSIGWNSVPDGQVPCTLRNSDNLINGHDLNAYSQYEKSNTRFKEEMEENKFSPTPDQGLNNPFCFKDIKNILDAPNGLENDAIKKMNNQVYTRSLHAEENAFLQMAKYGGDALEGGVLYSTASPCELCSKKAFQLGMKRIVYIDPYPGIAREQILQFGDNPPDVDLFKGAIGLAYHKLYDPILSLKDELTALSNR